VILSIIALIITAGNLWWYGTLAPDAAANLTMLAITNQLVAAAFGIAGFVTLSGRRWRPNYELGKPPIWTLRRAFTVAALLASVGAVLMPMSRYLGW